MLVNAALPKPVTAAGPPLRTRRLLHQSLGAVFLLICVLYVLEIDVPPLISRARFRGEPLDTNQDVTVATSDSTGSPPEPPFELPQSYWGQQLPSGSFLEGLLPLDTSSSETEPLSSLGKAADDTYDLGTDNPSRYRASLSAFVRSAFPASMQPYLLDGIGAYAGSVSDARKPAMEHKHIWQTAKDEASARDGLNDLLESWKSSGDGWDWSLVTDEKAAAFVANELAGSKIETVWKTLPSGIHRADMLRYLLLCLKGGIYSDTDTRRLKSLDAWGGDAKLWQDGKWMNAQERENGLKEPSVIVGIEADVGGREDWHDWWPRPLQIVQWTIASAPSHPIMLSALLRITHSTAHALDWAKAHDDKMRLLASQGNMDEAQRLSKITVLDEPKAGGPVGVMGWTGPGVFTDAVLSYLRVMYGLKWTDLKDLREPLRVGDVVMLPVTGFSPGIGMFGAKTAHNKQAMVEHGFAGSWKHD